VRSGATPFVLFVDDIVGQYQIVSKPLSPELRNLRGIAGSTILGDGRPALILEINQFGASITKKRSVAQENRGVA
ncbi:MAG: chemotaxis protein CheA, partial [Bdellovibrio sp.]